MQRLLLLGILQTGTGIEFEENDVTILHHVVTTLLPVLASGLAVCLGALFLKVLVVHHFSHDEALLEIRVNAASRLGCLGSLLHRPCLDLIVTGGEEVLQLKCLVSLQDDLLQVGGHFLVVLGELLPQGIILEFGPGVLECTGEWDNHCSGIVFVHPLFDLGQPLVLFTDVVGLRQIHQIHYGLRGEEEIFVQDIDLQLKSPVLVIKFTPIPWIL